MLRARLATAAVALPLLLALFLYGPYWAFTAFVAAIALLGIAEHGAMAFPASPRERAATLAAGALLVAAMLLGNPSVVLVALLTIVFAGFAWILFALPDFRQGLQDFGVMLVGVLLIGLFLPHFALLHQLPENGRLLAVFVVAVGMGGDTSGYFVGRRFGRSKLLPAVSPGKTVEGALGIMGGSILAAGLCKIAFLPEMGWIEVAAVATVMAVLGQIGDLSESVLKRTFGTKESGWLFPGHGGVLDRIDSLMFPVVFLYYYQGIVTP